MEFKIIISLALEILFIFCLWGLKKSYHSEDALLWLSDYELIEQLHGKTRTEYIEKSYRLVKLLIYFYMFLFPLSFFLSNFSFSFWLCMGLIFFITIVIILKSYTLQKQAKLQVKQKSE